MHTENPKYEPVVTAFIRLLSTDLSVSMEERRVVHTNSVKLPAGKHDLSVPVSKLSPLVQQAVTSHANLSHPLPAG